MREFGIGQSVPRVEDDQLLRGQGRYTDDVHLPGEVHLFVLRSPHASARIAGLETKAALEAPGVLAVLTGADIAAMGLPSVGSKVPRQRADGSPHAETPYLPLAVDRVVYVGDAVA